MPIVQSSEDVIEGALLRLSAKLERREMLGKKDLDKIMRLVRHLKERGHIVPVLSQTYFFLRNLTGRTKNQAEKEIFDLLGNYKEELGVAEYERQVAEFTKMRSYS